MADMKAILKQGLGSSYKKEREEDDEVEGTGTIKDLIAKAFTTRNLLHFAHWNTNSFAAHEALGELYDEIISQIDGIVEIYQGKFGIIQGASTMKASVPKNIVKHVEDEATWLCDNKCSISQDNDAIKNKLDELEAAYLKTIYKLKNLH